TAKSPLSAVTVTAPTLVLDGSPTTTIPSSELRLYREQNMYFTSPSNPEGDRGWWPDALVPGRDDGAAVFNNNGVWSEGPSSGETRIAFAAGVSARGNPDFHLWARLYGRFLLDHRITMFLPDHPDTSDWQATFATYDKDYGSVINGTDASQRLSGAQMTTLVYPWFDGNDDGSTAT